MKNSRNARASPHDAHIGGIRVPKRSFTREGMGNDQAAHHATQQHAPKIIVTTKEIHTNPTTTTNDKAVTKTKPTEMEPPKPMSFEEEVTAAIKLHGMPDPKRLEYVNAKAAPIKREELKDWKMLGYGEPVYVMLTGLGEGQIVMSKDDDYVVALFDINNVIGEDLKPQLFDPLRPTPRWNILWRVGRGAVQKADAAVKGIVQTPKGLEIAIVTAGVSDQSDNLIVMHYVPWEVAIARRNQKNAQFNSVLRRFFIDNSAALSRYMHMATTADRVPPQPIEEQEVKKPLPPPVEPKPIVPELPQRAVVVQPQPVIVLNPVPVKTEEPTEDQVAPISAQFRGLDIDAQFSDGVGQVFSL